MNKGGNMSKLMQQRETIIKNLPPLEDIIRGSLVKRYSKCTYPTCKCHIDRKYWHGPFYSIAVSKGKKTAHIYISINMLKEAELRMQNYNRFWNNIEKISDINIKLLKLGDKE